jgi:hypothetical protein
MHVHSNRKAGRPMARDSRSEKPGSSAGTPTNDQISWKGCLYIPFHRVPIAGGPFLSTSADFIDQHLELPPEQEFHQGITDRYVDGVRLPRRGLSAARLQGNSMIGRNIFDRDVIIFQCSDFNYVENGKIVVIEKHGDEEGMGAWSLKRLVIEPPSSSRNEQGDEIDSGNPTVILRSYNQKVRPWSLDPSGQYRIRGVLRRSIRPDDVRLVDSEMLQAVTDGE